MAEHEAEQIGQALRRLREKAGSPSYRHSAAGAMLDAGADIRDVKDFLGHASLAVTAQYLKRRSNMDRLREAMDRREFPAERPDAGGEGGNPRPRTSGSASFAFGRELAGLGVTL